MTAPSVSSAPTAKLKTALGNIAGSISTTAFAGMPTAGLTLESVIELAKEIELRLIRQGVMPDLYQVGDVLTRGSQNTQHTIFQIGPSSQ